MSNAINLHAATLVKLDGYMAAAGYGADHPWRAEIAAALAAPPVDTDSILDLVDSIDLAAGIVDDLLELAKGQCGAENEVSSAIRAARRYLVDIGVATTAIAGAAS
jgi:hypothetical protein